MNENVASRQQGPWARFRRAPESSPAPRIDGPRDPAWPWLCGGLAALVCLALLFFVFQKTQGRQTQDIKQPPQALPSERPPTATAAAPTAPVETTPVAVTTPVENAAPPKPEPPRIKAPADVPVQIVEWYPVNDASVSRDLTLLAVRVRLTASLVDSQEKVADYRVITSTSYATALEGVGWNRLSAGTPSFAGASARNHMERGLLFVVQNADVNSGEVYFQYRKHAPVLLPRDRRLASPASAAANTSGTQLTASLPQTGVATLRETNGQRQSDEQNNLLWTGGEGGSSAAVPSDGGSSGGASGLSVTPTGVIALDWASLLRRFPHHHRWHDRDRDRDRDKDHNKDDDKVKTKPAGNGGKGPNVFSGQGLTATQSKPEGSQGQPATPHFGQPHQGGLPQRDIPTFRPMPGHVPFALSHQPAFRPRR
jgi:hypothetical protein